MILAITGTIGAGKDTVVEYVTKTRGFKHFSGRKLLESEIDRRGLAQNRDSMSLVANDLRAHKSSSYIMEQLLKDAQTYNGDAAIESVRTLLEADFLIAHGAILIAVDANRRIRYERICTRGLSTDNVSFEKFCSQEDSELANKDSNKQNLLGVMALASYHIENNKSLAELYTLVDEIFTSFKK